MVGSKIVSMSVLAAVAGASMVFIGCSQGGTKGQFSGSIPGQFLEEKTDNSADQSASKSTVEAIQAQRRADQTLIVAALQGLERNIEELRRRDNELADKIASVDKSLGERIAVLESRVGTLEKEDQKFATILDAVKGDISKLEQGIVRLTQSDEKFAELIEKEFSRLAQSDEKFATMLAAVDGDVSKLKEEDIRLALADEKFGALLAAVTGDVSKLKEEDIRLALADEKFATMLAAVNGDVSKLKEEDIRLALTDRTLAASLEAVKGDISELQKEDIRLAQSIARNTRLINTLRSDFDAHLKDFTSKVSEVIKTDPGLKARFDTADEKLRQATAQYKAELEAAKQKAAQDLADATRAHQKALREAKDGYLVELQNASQKYQKAIDELRVSTAAIDKKFTDAEKQFRGDIATLVSKDKTMQDSINNLSKELEANKKKTQENHDAALKAVSTLAKHVADTYATKAALQTVADAQKTLRSAFLLLNGVPDKAASDKLLAADPALSAATRAITLTLNNAKEDHEKLKTYRRDFNTFKSNTERAIDDAMKQISAGNAEVDLLQKLAGEMAKTSILVATGEKNVSDAISKAIEKVKSGQMSQADFELLQKEFAASVKDRQDYEAATQTQLDKLGNRLTAVETKASQALALAQAAGRDISVMKGDIQKLYKNDQELQKNIDGLKQHFTTQISNINNKVGKMLANRTPEEFATQFQNTVTLAAQTNAQLKNLNDEFRGRLRTLEEFKTQAAADIAALEAFQSVMTNEMPKAVSAIQDFTAQHWGAVAKVIETLAPFQAVGNSPASQIATAFKAMALRLDPVCGFNINADFPSLGGEDYFAILGKRYLEALVYEDDAVMRSNPIYFSIPRIADRQSLLGKSLAPLFETNYNITRPDGTIDETKRAAVQACDAAVNKWVADVLYGPLGAGFRAELLANGVSLKEILQTMVGVARQANSPLQVIADHISGRLPNAIRTLQAEVAHHTRQIIELQQKTAALDRQLNAKAGIAQKLAAAQVAIDNLAQTDAKLVLNDAQLRNRISAVQNEMENDFKEIQTELSQLGEEFNKFRREQVATNSDLYAMISALATKTGLSDIAVQALKKAETIKVPTVPPTLPPNGSTTGLGLAGAGIDLATKPMQGFSFKCNTFWTDAAIGKDADCINARRIPNDREPTVLYSMESALVVASAGAPKAELFSGVSRSTGSNVAASWKKDLDINLEDKVFTLAGATKPVNFITGSSVKGVWMVPLASVITPYLTSQIRDVALMLISYGGDGKEINRINMFVRMYSPIVMNFAGNAAVPTSDFSSSNVRFDLDGNGSSEKVGWINARSSAGFLALDRDGNGKIDSGRELFGEATMLASGKTASDGYVALAEMDSNKDGFVDSQDKMFNKLSVWFDRNLNGNTEAGELVSLKDAKVTKIAVTGTEVKDSSKRAQNVFQNDHKLESRFWGPEACGSEGCSSYDIFFSQSIEVSKK